MFPDLYDSMKLITEENKSEMKEIRFKCHVK